MSIYDQIARGFNPGEGAVNAALYKKQDQQNKLAMQMQDRRLGLQEKAYGLQEQKFQQEQQDQLRQNMAKAVAWADTPEKWMQAVQHYQSQGIPIPPEYANVSPENFDQVRRSALASLMSPEQMADRVNPKPTSAMREYQFAQEDPGFAAYQDRKARAGATTVNVGGKAYTPGQEAIDKQFAKDVYVPFKAAGGFADVTKQLDQLSGALEAIKDPNKSITGPIVGLAPQAALEIFNPEAVDVREQVEEVVQRNLRLVLGAQFTEKEGERLISRAFNPRLPPEKNAERLQKLITQISNAAKARQDAIDYFDQNQTLLGFKGKTYTLADFHRALSETGGSDKPNGGWSIERAD